MKFADCEKWLYAHLDAGHTVHGVEFNDVEDVLVPSRLLHGCVAWPPGWLDEEKRYWRAMMEMPGGYMPADEVEGPSYWVMSPWWRRYLKGKAVERKRAYRKQVLRWLVGLDG